jgi:hypothetical protein
MVAVGWGDPIVDLAETNVWKQELVKARLCPDPDPEFRY